MGKIYNMNNISVVLSFYIRIDQFYIRLDHCHDQTKYSNFVFVHRV